MKDNVKQVIAVRKDLNMRKGKLAAQVAHASMKFIFDNNESEKVNEIFTLLSEPESIWMNESFTKVVVGVDSEDELQDLILKAQLGDIEVHQIVDSGKTEFNNIPTLTCAAFGPDYEKDIDRITGHLKLL